MKIATFNINGIKARIETLPRWLDEAQPFSCEPRRIQPRAPSRPSIPRPAA